MVGEKGVKIWARNRVKICVISELKKVLRNARNGVEKVLQMELQTSTFSARKPSISSSEIAPNGLQTARAQNGLQAETQFALNFVGKQGRKSAPKPLQEHFLPGRSTSFSIKNAKS